MHNSLETQQRIDDCRELYFKHEGKNHEVIEREMRTRGYADFHRRILYRRFERGRCRGGWIERFGWQSLLRNAECGVRNQEEMRNEEKEERIPSINTPHSAFRNPQSEDFDEFQAWLKRVSPKMKWSWEHQVYIYERLKRVTEGTCKRLMIFLPPRHGKSELVTVRYTAWRLKQDPSLNVIVGSYNQRLANRFSRKIRHVLTEDAGLSEPPASAGGTNVPNGNARVERTDNSQMPSKAESKPPAYAGGSDSVFPFVRQRPKNSEAEWETSEGGGLRAVGVGSGVTGFGAGLIVIDDPVKSRAEAESATYRDNIWDWFNDDLYTRLEPDGAIVLIQTRWHEDDLAGRLLRESQEECGEQWEVVNLPALAEGRRETGDKRLETDEEIQENKHLELRIDLTSPVSSLLSSEDPLGRSPGEALCPERYDEAALERLRRRLGSYSFASLYQQRPVPAGGGIFKREWFRNIISAAPPALRWKRGYDLAISKNADADYTASLRVAFDKTGNMYIDGGYRRRIEYPEQRRYILGRIENEPDTEHGVELSANGHAVIQDLRRERHIRGRAFRGVRVKGDKLTRALGWLALAEEGRVHLVRGGWNTDFIDEACAFPHGSHDDQIDAVSIAVKMHREQRGKLHTF